MTYCPSVPLARIDRSKVCTKVSTDMAMSNSRPQHAVPHVPDCMNQNGRLFRSWAMHPKPQPRNPGFTAVLAAQNVLIKRTAC